MSRDPLALVTSADVIARLEALAASIAGAPSDALLAFDADGTLWSGDVGIDNFEGVSSSGRTFWNEHNFVFRQPAAQVGAR